MNRKRIKLEPAQEIKVLKRLLKDARENLREQTEWADEYNEQANVLRAENLRLKAELGRKY